MGRRRVRRTLLRVVSMAGAAALVMAACAPGPSISGKELVHGTPLPDTPATVPFHTETVLSGLTLPTNVEFAADGRVFVAEKSGIIRSWADLESPFSTVVADLRDVVRNIGDHGLLGMAVDPAFPTRPYLYVLFTTDSTGKWGDGCPDPWPGYGVDGCVSGAEIARLTLDSQAHMIGDPHVVVDDRWCFQFSSHGVGDLKFLADGTLLASVGEGSAWWDLDFGQKGGSGGVEPNVTPANPCGDPPGGVGVRPSGRSGEGGAMRSQDLLTPGDPTGWNGSVVRIDPETGAAPPDDPLVGRGSSDDDAVVAHGLRNPFRMAVRPGTNQAFLADVGWDAFEEIDRTDVTDAVVDNFGWPCREGALDQPGFTSLGSSLCALAGSPDVVSRPADPWFDYFHDNQGASISGLEFVRPGRYPAKYDGSLLFGDYVRGEIWSLGVEPDGSRSDAPPAAVATGIGVVDLQAAPDGYVYAVDVVQGTVERLVTDSSGPIARLSADRTDGPVPLTVHLDASASTSPSGITLGFQWDLDGDGAFDDGTGATAVATYTAASDVMVRVRVTDANGASRDASALLHPGNTAPTVQLSLQAPALWAVGDDIAFQVAATDPEDGALPTSSLSWAVDLHHCASASDCHVHPLFAADGSTGFAFQAPVHEPPTYLIVRASARDSRGEVTEVERRLDPDVVRLALDSFPAGATISVGGDTGIAPFSLDVIRNATLSVSTPYQQVTGILPITFQRWSDGGARVHDVRITGGTVLTAEFSIG